MPPCFVRGRRLGGGGLGGGVTYSTDPPLRVRAKTGRTGWVWVGVRVPFWSAVNTPFLQLASHRRRSSLVLTPVGTPSWFFFPMWAPPPWLSPMWPHFLGLSQLSFPSLVITRVNTPGLVVTNVCTPSPWLSPM